MGEREKVTNVVDLIYKPAGSCDFSARGEEFLENIWRLIEKRKD